VKPRATYRLQFHAAFGFDQAAAIAPYLARLGISHVYASPYLKARPGSTHGYDIVDHNALNPELGDQASYDRMCTAFAAHGLKQILDFVPNHVGVGGADNPFWLDTLEWGPASPHAGWFDIDWEPDRPDLRDKVLVPVLGDQYGAVLDAGQLRLVFDADQGAFAVWAYDSHKLPICPLHYARILGDAAPELERLGDAFSGLPEWRPQEQWHAQRLKTELAALTRARPDLLGIIDTRLAHLNGGGAHGWRDLDALIRLQHWRVAYFRVAADDINYRRFFNINDLAGVRVELPDVFDHMHALALRLLAEERIDGLRIDHIDGLLDPKAYLRRLRQAGGDDFYLVVEKILAQHEALRRDWPVDGTTGYDFVNLALGLLVDPAGEEGLTEAYAAFAGDTSTFGELVRDCKLRIMDNEMASELNALARDAARVARQNPHTADFTRNILHRAIRAVVAVFPVYRTYLDDQGAPAADDRRDLDWAIAQARKLAGELDPSVFDFLHRLLSGDLVAQPRSGFRRYAALRCAMTFQQYSGPVMAKGLEDTAFYRFNRLIALNEVGGHPQSVGLSVAAFHKANSQRAQHWPNAMLGSSTHDTKRGEDARARLAVLSELPPDWSRNVEAWSRLLRARRGDMAVTAPPDRNDEYMFYQLLLGSWPVDLLDGDMPADALAAYLERVQGALIKSMREAKLHSTWAAPDAAYEAAMVDFAALALDPVRGAAFLASFRPFAARVARLGADNSLVQTVLKLTLPGAPDIYQGAELWDLSLVDPDNRRPVDYAERGRLLARIDGPLASLMADWRDGRFKLAAIARLLALRGDAPALFAKGDYEPITAQGPDADRICAFARRWKDRELLVVARRFPTRRGLQAGLDLPGRLRTGGWRDLLGGGTADLSHGLDARRLDAAAACVLVRQDE
jgi:(1->4)-alpha-D-glucan 1-alpha-D-glucosylmutase